MPLKDPDEAVVAVFKDFAVKNEARSAAAGRPMFDDIEIVELHFPGSKNWSAYPAAGFSHWSVDPHSGEQVKVSYAERFRRQYQQFKSHSVQTKSGTPLNYAPFLTEGRRAELRAQNIYTVEALASIDGQELKNIGQGGREMKNAAMEYLEETRRGAVNTQMQAELEALRAKNQTMEEDLVTLKAAAQRKQQAAETRADGTVTFEPADQFDGMTVAQLRDFIAAHTGHVPLGSLNRKVLLRMAREAQPDEAAA
jgi:hypothetical protein